MVLFTITNPSHTLPSLIIYNLESFGKLGTAGFLEPNAKQMRFTLDRRGKKPKPKGKEAKNYIVPLL